MGVVLYALFTYAVTAGISLATVAAILCVNKVMSRNDNGNGNS